MNLLLKDALSLSKALFLGMIMFFSVNAAFAQDCTRYQTTSDRFTDPVKSAISSLEKDSIFPPNTNFLSLRVDIFRNHGVARRSQQTEVNRRILFEECLTSRSAGLSARQIRSRLKALEDELFKNAGPGPLQTTTRNFHSPFNGSIIQYANFRRKSEAYTNFEFTANGSITFVQSLEKDFIRDTPFVVIDENKYFVIVASIIDRNEAIRRSLELNATVDELDFVVYPPYRGNRYHSIMAATWVDRRTANQALSLARSLVAEDSFLWACQSDGVFC